MIGRRIDRNAQTNAWRRLPAAEKAAFAVGLMIASLAGKGWLVQGLIIVTMVSLLVRGARVAFRDVLATATIPAGFIAASTLAQVVTLRFDHLTPVLGLSWAALEPSAYVGVRSFACVLALLGLALTTPLTDILGLLRRMGVAPEVSDIALMMFRFIWLTLDCAEAGAQSQADRLGYSTYRRTLHSLGLLLASLLPRVLRRAQRLEAGLASRGYSGELRFIELQQPTSVAHFAVIVGLVLSVAFIGRVLP